LVYYKFKDRTYYSNASCGFAGEPVMLYKDREYLDWTNVTKRLFNGRVGRKIGDSMLKLWGSVPDTLESDLALRGIFDNRFLESLF